MDHVPSATLLGVFAALAIRLCPRAHTERSALADAASQVKGIISCQSPHDDRTAAS